MKADSNQVKPQLLHPRKKYPDCIEMCAIFLPEGNEGTVVVRIYTEKELCLRHMRLDRVQLIYIIEGRAQDACFLRKDE
jgi:hypothetical protein